MNNDAPDTVLRSSIIAEITAAFEGVQLKDGVTLHQARAMDDYESLEAQRKVRLNDTEHRWQDISDEKLRHFHDVFPYLDYTGFRFYIPAFMIWVLKHLDDEDAGFNCSAVYQFQHHYRPDSSVTEKQGRAVCRFLRYLAQYRDLVEVKEALDAGWNRYCPEESMS
jgi:hypothetical protein